MRRRTSGSGWRTASIGVDIIGLLSAVGRQCIPSNTPDTDRPCGRYARRSMYDRLRAWLDRWGPILPLLVAEFIVWLGFGSLLPVLPIYFHEQGLDLATLGLVIAAWPAARLVSEPIFGWLADRTARVPLMVIGLVATGVFGALPLVWTGPARVPPAPRRRRSGVGDVRPCRARLPDRCHAARASWRGVRPVRRRPDGRAADRPVDRRIRRGAVRRHRLRVRVQRRRRDRRGGRRSRSVSARRVPPTRPAHRPRPTGPRCRPTHPTSRAGPPRRWRPTPRQPRTGAPPMAVRCGS